MTNMAADMVQLKSMIQQLRLAFFSITLLITHWPVILLLCGRKSTAVPGRFLQADDDLTGKSSVSTPIISSASGGKDSGSLLASLHVPMAGPKEIVAATLKITMA